MKDKNMDKWLRIKCPSVIADWDNKYCAEKLSICVGCGRIISTKILHKRIQCMYATKYFHCGFPEISEPLKIAYQLLGRN